MTWKGIRPCPKCGSSLPISVKLISPHCWLPARTFAVLVAFQRLLPRWPGPLIAMVLAAVAVAVLDLDQMGVATVGSVPRGLPPASIPDFSAIDLSTLLPAALGVTIVAYSDNIATARAFAARRREEIDARQEFLALGAANLGAGLFSGFPCQQQWQPYGDR